MNPIDTARTAEPNAHAADALKRVTPSILSLAAPPPVGGGGVGVGSLVAVVVGAGTPVVYARIALISKYAWLYRGLPGPITLSR